VVTWRYQRDDNRGSSSRDKNCTSEYPTSMSRAPRRLDGVASLLESGSEHEFDGRLDRFVLGWFHIAEILEQF
jgi:hypothetical protein